MAAPVVLVGCGRLGSAVIEGWLAHGGLAPERLIVMTPSPKPAAERAAQAGARVNPRAEALADVGAAVLAVKPSVWREAAAPLVGSLPSDAVVLSLMAGVRSSVLSGVFGARPLARLMPTTAVAQGQGVAALWAAEDRAAEVARALFQPLADVVDLADEAYMDAATAVAGSGPAFIHAFVRSLADAGTLEGLPAEAAVRLARGALESAAAGLATGEPLEALIARIASPGGTTEAGLKAAAEDTLNAAERAVAAATQRARALASD